MPLKKRAKLAKVETQSFIGGRIDFKQKEFNFTEKQQEILKCLLDEDTKMVFLSGCSGTSKSYLAIYAALHLLERDWTKDILYVRTIQESGSKSLGSLPGEVGSKFGPFQIPLEEKCQEILTDASTKELFAKGKLQAIPVNYLRGLSWNNKVVIFDECQNAVLREIVTCATRAGKNTKIIFAGDNAQIDLAADKSGFADFIKAFSDQEARDKGIFHFHFTKEDILRSEILKFIIERIESIPRPIHK